MPSRKAGSSVCEASSSVFFNECVPCGMSLVEDVRKLCLGYQKGQEKIVLERKKESMPSVPDWSVYSRIALAGALIRERK